MQYWNQLATEHGIDAEGNPLPINDDSSLRFHANGQAGNPLEREDRPELFFTLSDSNKYTPRAILVDLEPTVISKCTNSLPMFNPRNVHLSEQGSGAANNWQQGHSYGVEHQEELLNLIDREVDKCENVSNFQLFHSVAGGTGAGVGSLLLELLNDRYGSKKLINTFSVFPSNEKTSDVVVQPYNTVLTLKRLIDYSDATFVFHNDALNSIENALFNTNRDTLDGKTAFDGANKLIAFVAASVSNPIRFPNYMYSSYESILSTLVPTPELKFLTSSIAPFTSSVTKHNYTNEYEMILELLSDRYKMNRVTEPIKYISVLNYLIGRNLHQDEMRKGLLKAQQRLEFVPWTPSSIQMVNGKRPPFGNANAHSKNLHGIQLSNNTSIVQVFSKILKQYDLLAKREAYINSYTELNDRDERARVMDMFGECRESVASVIDEYRACQSLNYLEDDILDEDMG